MTKTRSARYTLEFKQEAVRLVEGGQSSTGCSGTTALDGTRRWPAPARCSSSRNACQSAKASQLMSSSMVYGFQGQGQGTAVYFFTGSASLT